MKYIILTTAIFLFLCSPAFGQKTEDLDIDFMLRGHIYARSSITDSTAPGGFGSSDNLARKINRNLPLTDSGLFLKIDTTRASVISDKYNGYKLYLANKSDTTARFRASDSRLSVIAEVYYQGEWKPIEYLPRSWCGNSYHYVYLKQNEYWEFDIPKFAGKTNTKLRYKLILSAGKFLYSNEISASFNTNQLELKQGHTPDNLMDPYED